MVQEVDVLNQVGAVKRVIVVDIRVVARGRDELVQDGDRAVDFIDVLDELTEHRDVRVGLDRNDFK